ncbi:gamma carbonic anhydrase family protein [Candidatus Magnetaquicoccus inordinatus]|uniref:gamma carbonic anhydrase family protein n=1 Tax=Candidatus Magnetaquicoccus inordinatus TaxID=2496818 RepID=UPI00102BAC15|nr:gamma carbonic anhydrase family protein [Candidatus Magnetaquicoccus inordinatus]
MPVEPYRDIWPSIDPTAYVHPSAVIIGDVHIGANCSIWPGVVIRGDVNYIRIGARSNVQDGSILHVTRVTEEHPQGIPLLIDEDVTIGHQVSLHACHLRARSMVGIGAIVLDGVVVEEEAMVGAGSLVAPGKRVGAGELWLGSPAKMVRILDERARRAIAATTENYVRLANEYRLSTHASG